MPETEGRTETRKPRSRRLPLILLGVTLFLWLLALPEIFRVAGTFGPLLKLFGPWIVFGTMLVCPVLAA